jgi:hypothetical protein
MVTGCVLFEVQAEFLNTVQTSFGFKGLKHETHTNRLTFKTQFLPRRKHDVTITGTLC